MTRKPSWRMMLYARRIWVGKRDTKTKRLMSNTNIVYFPFGFAVMLYFDRFMINSMTYSCASALLDMDVPLKVISQMLGHFSIKGTADIYCDVLEKNMQPAELMQEVFFAG